MPDRSAQSGKIGHGRDDKRLSKRSGGKEDQRPVRPVEPFAGDDRRDDDQRYCKGDHYGGEQLRYAGKALFTARNALGRAFDRLRGANESRVVVKPRDADLQRVSEVYAARNDLVAHADVDRLPVAGVGRGIDRAAAVNHYSVERNKLVFSDGHDRSRTYAHGVDHVHPAVLLDRDVFGPQKGEIRGALLIFACKDVLKAAAGVERDEHEKRLVKILHAGRSSAGENDQQLIRQHLAAENFSECIAQRRDCGNDNGHDRQNERCPFRQIDIHGAHCRGGNVQRKRYAEPEQLTLERNAVHVVSADILMLHYFHSKREGKCLYVKMIRQYGAPCQIRIHIILIK